MRLFVLLIAAFAGCAHVVPPPPTAEATPMPPILGEGRYAIELLRSRAIIDGKEEIIEMSESGSAMLDGRGASHLLVMRGQIELAGEGKCQLAVAVSVNGEAPGVSERSCTWAAVGDRFELAETDGRSRTVYAVQKDGDHYTLDGLHVVGTTNGRVLGDANGERVMLIEGRGPLKGAARPAKDIESDSEKPGEPEPWKI